MWIRRKQRASIVGVASELTVLRPGEDQSPAV
jgi:hypothetical protein